MRSLVILTAILVSQVAVAPAQAGGGCNTRSCHHRVAIKKSTAKKRAAVAPYDSWLDATASCESRGRWRLSSGNGYFGGLQFTLPTWRAAGGRGLPHESGELEQKYRAVRWLRMIGWANRGTSAGWPVCGRH